MDDLAALLSTLGGTAALYGHSSGAGLAAIAASTGLPFTKLVLHEPPYGPDDVDSSEDGGRVLELLDEGRNQEAVELFLLMTGLPQAQAVTVAALPGMAEIAPSLPYDFAVMAHGTAGGGTPVELLRSIKPETLVLAGTASPPFMVDAAHRIASILPTATYAELPDQHHVVPPELLAPVVKDFLSR